MSVRIVATLAVAAVLFGPHFASAAGGTSGFPDLDDIYRKATLIHGLIERNEEQRIFPDIRFNCSGSISKWHFVARDRGEGNGFPELQIFSTANDMMFSRESRVREIEGDVTLRNTSDPFIYEYSTNTPFEDGNIFGLHQPRTRNSKLIVQYQEGGGPLNYRRVGGSRMDVDTTDGNVFSDQSDYPLVAVEANPPECVHGFLTLDALRSIVAIRAHEGEQRVIPDLEFGCEGQIMKWVIGVQRRRRTGPENTPDFPQIQLWRLQGGSFDRVDYRNVIPSDLTSTEHSNVFEYIPDPPMEFRNGDVLGLYQPTDSEIVLYYQFDGGPLNHGEISAQPLTDNFDPDDSDSGGNNERDSDFPLISVVITADPAEDADGCPVGFINQEVLRNKSALIENFVEAYEEQRTIPNINFTTDGSILKWTFAARDLGMSAQRTEYPQLLVATRTEGGSFTTTTLTQQPSQTGFLNVYEYVLDPPFPYLAGDALAIHQPSEETSRLALSFVADAGSLNVITDLSNPVSQIFFRNDLPLVSVEISTISTITASPTSTQPAFQTPTSNSAFNPSTDSTPPMTSTQISLPPLPTQTQTLVPTQEDSTSDSVSLVAVAGGAAGGLLVSVLLITVVTAVFCVVVRKRTKTRNINIHEPHQPGSSTLTKEPINLELSENIAYGTAHTGTIPTVSNEAYGSAHTGAIPAVHNEAYGTAHTGAIPTVHNEAYGTAHTGTIPTVHNEAYGTAHTGPIPTVSNEAYGTAHTGAIPTVRNEAYGTAQREFEMSGNVSYVETTTEAIPLAPNEAYTAVHDQFTESFTQEPLIYDEPRN